MEMPSPETVAWLRSRLLDFFDRESREMPWRSDEPDPYRVWVSEVMLQQTRVDTVVPYYRRWMERFPDVDTLASAELDDVLSQWTGLGYYSRARNLHRAARTVRERFGGRLPDTAEGLRELPGIGAYTAGAVASIAFDRPEPAVDGNVRRVFSRWFDEPDPSAADLAHIARALVDPERPGDFNQAVMELGATVCTPRSPSCPVCPITDECGARHAGTVADRPKAKRRTKVREIDVGVVVPAATTDSGWRLWIVRRPEEGLLGGMWEFPAIEGVVDPESVLDRFVGAGVPAPPGRVIGKLEPVPHIFSHLKARYHPVVVQMNSEVATEGPKKRERNGGGRWLGVDDIEGAALPVAQRKIALAAVGRLMELIVPE